MSNYWNICKHFVAGEKIKRSWVSRVSGRGGWNSTGPLHAYAGTSRLDVKEEHGCTHLLSYGSWKLAVRKADETIIVNADNAPTVTSRKQQRDFRSALGGNKHALIPFSALGATGILPEHVEVLDTTPDREIVSWRRCPKDPCWHTKNRESDYVRFNEDGTHDLKCIAHFLGETLFAARRRFGTETRLYVCGLDRNDNPAKRNFYMAQLPEGAAAATVDEALALLRPPGLPEGTLRQGEWFFVPAPDVRAKEAENCRLIRQTPLSLWRDELAPGVPILTTDVEEIPGALNSHDINFFARTGRARRHRATRMYVNGAVYVSGMVRDEEHNPLKLGNGKTWYLVVRNLATGSWGAGGKVD